MWRRTWRRVREGRRRRKRFGGGLTLIAIGWQKQNDRSSWKGEGEGVWMDETGRCCGRVSAA